MRMITEAVRCGRRAPGLSHSPGVGRGVCVLAAVVACGIVVHAAESLRVTPTVRDDKVLVTFELADAYTDSVHEAIASGLRTTFTYDLELRTIVPAWVDRTVATVSVSTTDHYDNLTRKHTLTRSVDGRVEDVLVTDDEQKVKSWLTTWTRLPLCDTSRLDPTRDYYVRVTARTRQFASLLGWGKSVVGQAKFSFVP
jgi:Domain of unknown function (DUF4390)